MRPPETALIAAERACKVDETNDFRNYVALAHAHQALEQDVERDRALLVGRGDPPVGRQVGFGPDRGGEVRECSGSTLTGIVPTNTYRCKDGKDVIIGANGDSIFKRLCDAMGKPEMGNDPRFADNAGRVEHEPEIDAVIAEWMKQSDGVGPAPHTGHQCIG